MYSADGRANSPSLGRHSLGTRDKTEALELIHDLDLNMAVKYGRADRSLTVTEQNQLLELQAGRELYEKHVRRPAVAGGPRPTTSKRYKAVLDKFLPFAENQKVRYWNEVTDETLNDYAAWLDGEGYAYATEYLELTTIKQILKYLVKKEHLPADSLFDYPLRKPVGTDTYCWTPEEVKAMFDHCVTDELHWLRRVLMGLASTGLRIMELASLRWSDIDLQRRVITLTDESHSKSRKKSKRTTKSGDSRSFPIHDSLLAVLQEIERAPDGLVFHGPLGGRIKADTIRRILIRDVLTPLEERFPSDHDEIGFKDGRLHSFRHYFCSVCANSGVPEQMLMKWLGHKSSTMVRRYYHLHDEESQRQMKRVAITGTTISDTSGESE
jgi:integrase